MARRETNDGGHTAFTDHLIARRPRNRKGQTPEAAPLDRLIAWREPAPELRVRNLALAFLNAGVRDSSPALIDRSYGMLLEVRKAFPADPAVLSGAGAARRIRGEPLSAARLFDRVIELQPGDPLARENAGLVWMDAGEKGIAAARIEQALALDPLLLTGIESLLKLYRESGDAAKETALMDRVRQAMRSGPR